MMFFWPLMIVWAVLVLAAVWQMRANRLHLALVLWMAAAFTALLASISVWVLK